MPYFWLSQRVDQALFIIGWWSFSKAVQGMYIWWGRNKHFLIISTAALRSSLKPCPVQLSTRKSKVRPVGRALIIPCLAYPGSHYHPSNLTFWISPMQFSRYIIWDTADGINHIIILEYHEKVLHHCLPSSSKPHKPFAGPNKIWILDLLLSCKSQCLQTVDVYDEMR